MQAFSTEPMMGAAGQAALAILVEGVEAYAAVVISVLLCVPARELFLNSAPFGLLRSVSNRCQLSGLRFRGEALGSCGAQFTHASFLAALAATWCLEPLVLAEESAAFVLATAVTSSRLVCPGMHSSEGRL